MAKMELRKPIDLLLTEKNNINKQLTTIQDQFNVKQELLTSLRSDQFSCREGKEHLSVSNMNKPARRVFDNQIAQLQMKIDEVLKELDVLEKDRVVVSSRAKAIDKSLKELQNA